MNNHDNSFLPIPTVFGPTTATTVTGITGSWAFNPGNLEVKDILLDKIKQRLVEITAQQINIANILIQNNKEKDELDAATKGYQYDGTTIPAFAEKQKQLVEKRTDVIRSSTLLKEEEVELKKLVIFYESLKEAYKAKA